MSVPVLRLQRQRFLGMSLVNQTEVPEAVEWEEERRELELDHIESIDDPWTKLLILGREPLLVAAVIQPAEYLFMEGRRGRGRRHGNGARGL